MGTVGFGGDDAEMHRSATTRGKPGGGRKKKRLKEEKVFKRIVRVALPLAVLAVVAAVTIGSSSSCFSIPYD